MRVTAAILWNTSGQALQLRFPLGRPTSATFAVYRALGTDDGPPEFSGSATVDAATTTTSAAAGPAQADPTLLSLTSTAGFTAGRAYQLLANGVHEEPTVVELGAGYVRVRDPLQTDYAGGAAFASTWLSAAVDPTWVADLSKLSVLSDTYPDYRVKWTVLYAGATYTLYSFFDVVRVIVGHHVTADDIDGVLPGWIDSMPVQYRVEAGRPIIDGAWKALRSDLQTKNIDINSVREDEVIDQLVLLRSAMHIAEGGWHPPTVDWAAFVALRTSKYDRALEQHFEAAIKHQLDDYQLGSFAANPEHDRHRVRPGIFVK